MAITPEEAQKPSPEDIEMVAQLEKRIEYLETRLEQALRDMAEARELAGHLTSYLTPFKRRFYEDGYPWLNKR